MKIYSSLELIGHFKDKAIFKDELNKVFFTEDPNRILLPGDVSVYEAVTSINHLDYEERKEILRVLVRSEKYDDIR